MAQIEDDRILAAIGQRGIPQVSPMTSHCVHDSTLSSSLYFTELTDPLRAIVLLTVTCEIVKQWD